MNPLNHKESILVHGYFVYSCDICGTVVNMYLQKGLEDKVEFNKTGKHKPVPFVIRCPMCKNLSMRHILWGVGNSDEYEPLPDGESFFLNDDQYDCGVPVHPQDIMSFEENRERRRHHMNYEQYKASKYKRPRKGDMY